VSIVLADNSETLPGETLQVSCNCPAADYQDVCKHVVAVALRVENTEQQRPLGKVMPESDKNKDLQEWFKQKSVTELSEIILSYVIQSKDEEARWQLAMLNEQGGLNAPAISKLITKALPAKQIWEWHKVSAYFDHADRMFGEILLALQKLDVDAQWSLILKALIRLNKVLGRIDDSGGFRFNLEGLLNEKLTALFTQLSWSDDKKAEWIFAHFKEYKYDIFPRVPEDFELSAEVNNAFLNICTAEIEKREKAGVQIHERKQKWAMKRLTEPLLTQAKQLDDWQETCRLLQKSAFDHQDFLAISKIYLAHDAQHEANHSLQQAYQQAHTAYETAQCQAQEVNMRVSLQAFSRAWQLRWQMFNDNPNFIGYKKLLTLEQQTGVIDPDFIQKIELILMDEQLTTVYGGTFNADALLEFYMHRNELDKARNWVSMHRVNPESLQQLANLIIVQHPQEAIDLYQRIVVAIIMGANNPAYQEATIMLLKLEEWLTNNQPDSKAMLYLMIAKIINKQKAKRNLMKLLKASFAHCFK